jgi:lysophospholipase L1-like esterase
MRGASLTSRLLAYVVFAAVGAPALRAQVADPDPQRYDSAFARFAHWDEQNSYPRNAVLFVGSSSIVRWSTAEAFPNLPVINRGFGGSQASDVPSRVAEGVTKYDPSVVVYYEGDNDAAAGKGAEQIFEDVREFSEAVLAFDASTRIVLLSVKPSPLRWERWSVMQDTNELMRRYAESEPTVEFVDVATAMLGADGQPMPHLYVADRLHMTPAGYEIWNRIVGPVLAGLTRVQ